MDSPLELLKWVVRTRGEEFAPFEAIFDEAMQIQVWHCWGCDGEFISRWPRWEKPTLRTFKHKHGCRYVAVIKATSSIS